MMARCPYCDCETFSESIRADSVDPENPERFSEVYGQWFNSCGSCGGWSLYDDGVQTVMDDPSTRPEKHSLAPVV